MKYYRLMYDYENSDDYVLCKYYGNLEFDRYLLESGILFNGWNEIEFRYNPDDGDVFSDYLANVYVWLLVSEKFRELIKEAVGDDAIQYLPVRITDENGKHNTTEYAIANLLDVVDGLDLTHSKYAVFKAKNRKINVIEFHALKKEKIKGHDIFRLKDYTIPVFVSERVKNIIEDNGLTGFDFLEVGVY